MGQCREDMGEVYKIPIVLEMLGNDQLFPIIFLFKGPLKKPPSKQTESVSLCSR